MIRACASKCETEKKLLQKEYEAIRAEIRKSQIKYHELLILNVKKDLEIRDLKLAPKDKRFSEFSTVWPANIIDELRKIDGAQNEDSNFISKVMRGFYHEELYKLKERTYSGRSKQALTPEKVKYAKHIFSKRLQLLGEYDDHGQRYENFSKHVKTSIENINKILKK